MLIRITLVPVLLLLAGMPAAGQDTACLGRIPGLSLVTQPHARATETILVLSADGRRLAWQLSPDSLPDRLTPRAVPYRRYALVRSWEPDVLRLAGLYRGAPLLRLADDTLTSLPAMALVWAGPPCKFQAYQRIDMTEPGVGQALPRDRSTLDSLALVMEYCGEQSCPAFRAVLLPGVLRYVGREDAHPRGRCEARLPRSTWRAVHEALGSLREDSLAGRYGMRLHAPKQTLTLYFRETPPIQVSGPALPGPLERIRRQVEELVHGKFGFRDATAATQATAGRVRRRCLR